MINIIFNSVETKNIFKDYGLECRFLKISLKNTKIKQKQIWNDNKKNKQL